ncbi:hypothetical protein Pyn_34845 [Prunus yedoensis var. nudiflora]|uniref:RNase H type-1 domain-containing protein n=1 Tax=Prunus yedoensis var. nudiflora TaxID=2094558 RepID=A0A314Y0S8_PRUYE|nr:hypothetical protein Pyn_34845 [Prunus yedoensis var. nudiflora]
MDSTIHILRDFPFARGVWTNSSSYDSRAQSQDQGIHDLFLCCLENLPHVVFELFLSIGWAIWRQEMTSYETTRTCPRTELAMALLLDCSAEGGVGIVVRDSEGYFVTRRALHVDNIYSTQVEAIAAREGAVLAVEKGFTNFIFESNSLQIVYVLRTTTPDRAFISPIVEDTKSMMSQNTGEVFTHIGRTATWWLIGLHALTGILTQSSSSLRNHWILSLISYLRIVTRSFFMHVTASSYG